MPKRLSSGMAPVVMAALFLAACGEDSEPTAAPQNSGQTPSVASASLDQLGRTPSNNRIEGGVSFLLDGESKSLPHIPADRAFYMNLASQVTFHAAEGSTESLMLNIMGVDLKALDYPVELPQKLAPGESMTMANRPATVGWAYMAEDGEEWTTGTAVVRLEGFSSDGVLSATFPETVLRNGGGNPPEISLAEGEFEVRLTSPW